MVRRMLASKTSLAVILTWLLGAMLCFDLASGELPQEIFFQARLSEKKKGAISGSHKIKFRLYATPSGGSPIWSETQTLVADSLGIVSCYLGSITGFPTELNFNSSYYLSLEVDNDGEMSPRVKLVSALGALNSRRLAGLSSTQFLRSDTAATMSGPFSLSSYLAQTYSGIDTEAMSITYNPASGSHSALALSYGAGGGSGAALTITQSGQGDILQLFDSSAAALFVKDGGNVGIGTSAPVGLLQVGSASSPGLLVTPAGNIGVGTLSPTEKLEVKGTLKATAFSGDASNLTGISGLISGLTAGRITKAGSATTLADSAIVESGGNIGIATTTPLAKLQVSGSFIATGNVGIGTNSPVQLLDVVGGAIRTDNQLISTVASGTAPLAVSSSTLVTNLNADELDGYHSSDFMSSNVIASGTENYLAKYTGATSLGASTVIYDNGTNIGIGMANPSLGKLQVNGAVYANAFFVDASAVSADTAQPYLSSSLGSGLVKITAGSGALSVVTDSSTNWDAAYTNRISSVSATAPLVLSLANNTLSGSIARATASADGYLAYADWNTFNNKQDALSFSTGLSLSSNTLSADLSCGVSGGQSVIGGIGAGENLTLSSTSHATKGKIIFGSASAYDQANDRLGLGSTAASAKLEIIGAGTVTGMAFRLRDNSGADKVVILDNGNIGLGTANPKHKLEMVGDIKFTGCIKQGDLGDLAEMMPYSSVVLRFKEAQAETKSLWGLWSRKKALPGELANNPDYNRVLFGRPEAGEVVVIDKGGGIRRSFQPYVTNAVGIVSTRPAQLLRYDRDNAAPIALSGIVPCKVTNENGAIEPGDLLVCSSLPGHAMKAGSSPAVGSVIGKALGRLDKKQKTAVIEVLVTLK